MIYINIKEGKGEGSIDGDVAELATEITIIVRSVYRQIREKNAEDAERFKSCLKMFAEAFPEQLFPED